MKQKRIGPYFPMFFFLNSDKGPAVMGQPQLFLQEDLTCRIFLFSLVLNYIPLHHIKIHGLHC